jgi:DNA-binding CsgD family transcriptional regulator
MPQNTVNTRLRRLPGIYAELRGCANTADLFAHAAAVPRPECGFERALVLSVTPRGLSAVDSGALDDGPSDQLRRRALASPVPLVRGTEEAELVRRGDLAQRAHPPSGRSILASALALDHYAFGPVVADAKTLALVVADRPDEEVDDDDRLWVDLFAAMLSVALVDVVMRERVAEISAELRHFTASALALVREATEGSIALPSSRGAGPSLPRIGLGTDVTDVASLFSERETRVAELLVEGKSNRQIAEELVVSPETVKTHVGRILRKLGAHNRAEAVGLFLRLRER